MKYVFHPDALAEYADAVKYYATQNSNIAQAFINSIEDTVYRKRDRVSIPSVSPTHQK